MAEKSKVLVIGVATYIGKFMVEASARSGHPTFALVGPSAPSDLVRSFESLGVYVVQGDENDLEALLNAIKKVDVVISTVGTALQVQYKIVTAIKAAGNIKRFLPSEFGKDVDRGHALEPEKNLYAAFYAMIRHLVEAEGIPYTYVAFNFFAGRYLSSLAQPEATVPPRDKVVILGDGNAKGGYICTYTIKAVDDPRTLNKTLYIRPPANTYSMNDLVSLWESKIGKILERIYIPEEQVLKDIEEAEFPNNMLMTISHAVFVRGDQTNFEIEPSSGVEASELYPDVKYTTVDEYLDQFV